MSRPEARRLDATTLAKLASLQLRVKRVVEGTMAGLHRAPHHGSSVEFAEHKEYSPGDDLRRLDWKVYGKSDRYYVRQFEDETELRAYLLLDCSGSMGYGRPLSKLDYGAVLAGSLAHLLARQRDQPSLMAFADEVRCYIPPRSRSSHAAALLAELSQLAARGATDPGRALARLSEVIARRSLVVLISDLFATQDVGRQLRQLRARGHEVVLFHLLHPDEVEFPFQRVTIFESMEGPEELLVDPGGVRDAYLAAFDSFARQLARSCREGQMAYQRVTTADALDAVLVRLLRGGW